MVADFALNARLPLYWLVLRLSASRNTAAVVLLTFAGFQIADPSFLTAQHRWDSATLALAGLCLLVDKGTAVRVAASGVLLAAAAWCTPSMALVGGVAVGWFAISRERRGNIAPFLGGVTAVSLAALCALAATGSVAAFFHQMLWLRHNYSSVNILPYGSVIGGYRALFEGANGIGELIVRIILVACIAIPAILPPAAILLWGFALWRGTAPEEHRRTIPLLLFATAALVMTAFPRADVMHLAFIAALPYALVAAAVLPDAAALAGRCVL